MRKILRFSVGIYCIAFTEKNYYIEECYTLFEKNVFREGEYSDTI